MENYIFDFGQVLVRFDPDYMTAAYIKDEKQRQSVRDIIFDRFYWDKLDYGGITDEQLKAEVCKRVPEALRQDAVRVYDDWYKNLPFIDGMVDLVKEIKKKGGRLFLLSNISSGFAENYKKVPVLEELFSLFDGLVFSAPLGIVKPNAEIFEYLLNKYKLDRTVTVFIDDSEKNINGAREVGIKGILFDGDVKKLKDKLF